MKNLMNRVGQNTMTADIVTWVRAELDEGRNARLGRWIASPRGDLYRGDEDSRSTPEVTGAVHVGSATPTGPLAESLVRHWLGDWKRVKVRIRMVRWVDAEVEVEDDAARIDVEDAGADLYYRGRVVFPEGSPSLEVVVLDPQ